MFICGFKNWRQFWGLTYNSKFSNWKNILTNKDNKWLKPICTLFDFDKIDEDTITSYLLQLDDSNDVTNFVHFELCKEKLLTKLDGYDCVLNYKYGKYVLFSPGAKANYNKFVIDFRNKIFAKLMDDKVIEECKQRLPDVPYFWGYDINFQSKSKTFLWKINGNESGNLFEKDNDGNFQITIINGIGINDIDMLEKYLKNLPI
jgi:hypothetical protein